MSLLSPTLPELAAYRPSFLARAKHALRDQPLLRAGVLRAGALLSSIARSDPGIYVLCYHHVAPKARAGFERQIAFLKRYGTFIDADTALRRMESGQAAGERSFLLTFDDGYLDNVEVALPVIREQGVPAIQFLVSDWIDAPPEGPVRFMGRPEVSAWLAAGLDIGSHSASHRQFSRLGTLDAAAEFTRSAEALAGLAGRPVTHFACPWGVPRRDFLPERDGRLARDAGYRTFFTTSRGHVGRGADRMALPRHVLEPEWPLYQLQALMGANALARG